MKDSDGCECDGEEEEGELEEWIYEEEGGGVGGVLLVELRISPWSISLFSLARITIHCIMISPAFGRAVFVFHTTHCRRRRRVSFMLWTCTSKSSLAWPGELAPCGHTSFSSSTIATLTLESMKRMDI